MPQQAQTMREVPFGENWKMEEDGSAGTPGAGTDWPVYFTIWPTKRDAKASFADHLAVCEQMLRSIGRCSPVANPCLARKTCPEGPAFHLHAITHACRTPCGYDQNPDQLPPELQGDYDDERHAAEPASLPVHFTWHLATHEKKKPTSAVLEETAKETVESSGFTNVVATHCKDRACKDRRMHAHVVGQMSREMALHYMDRCLGA